MTSELHCLPLRSWFSIRVIENMMIFSTATSWDIWNELCSIESEMNCFWGLLGNYTDLKSSIQKSSILTVNFVTEINILWVQNKRVYSGFYAAQHSSEHRISFLFTGALRIRREYFTQVKVVKMYSVVKSRSNKIYYANFTVLHFEKGDKQSALTCQHLQISRTTLLRYQGMNHTTKPLCPNQPSPFP